MEAKKQLKHLIIYCNPNPKSLSAVYKEAVMKLKKIFEKFKKVVDFIARLYYNLSCVTDETQTTRTQQHSLRGVAQLG